MCKYSLIHFKIKNFIFLTYYKNYSHVLKEYKKSINKILVSPEIKSINVKYFYELNTYQM